MGLCNHKGPFIHMLSRVRWIQNVFTHCCTYRRGAAIHYFSGGYNLHIAFCNFQVLKQAKIWKSINHNPASDLVAPKSTDIHSEMNARASPSELIEIMSVAEPTSKNNSWVLHNAIFIAINTGMREAEICGLKWSDFNVNKLKIMRSLQVVDKVLTDCPTKSKRPRTITVSDETVTYLKNLFKKQKEDMLAISKPHDQE